MSATMTGNANDTAAVNEELAALNPAVADGMQKLVEIQKQMGRLESVYTENIDTCGALGSNFQGKLRAAMVELRGVEQEVVAMLRANGWRDPILGH